MPNPSISTTPTSAPAAPSANGILARIGGQYISAGVDQLPPAGPQEMAERVAVVPDVPDLGNVRIRYMLNSYRHGRARHWHWLAVHAEVVE